MTAPGRRHNLRLRAQYRAIAAYVGLTLGLIGIVIITPLLVLLAWPEEVGHAVHFLVPGLLLLGGGAAMFQWLRPREAVLSVQDGGLIVVLSWLGACLAGTWPLMAVEDMNFTQAFFESVSGWTTTGLSVIDYDSVAKITLLFRSTMQLVGGAGFAIIMLAALTGPAGTGLPTAEGRSEQLVPHVRESARLVVLIYTSYVIIGTVALRIAGMEWFDAVNHAFAALSTGGFSTRVESIGYWDSLAVEAVTLPLMFLGSLNFLTAYMLWRGRWWAFLRDSEVRFVAFLVPIVAGLLLLIVCRYLYPTVGKSLRVAVFETVSCMTTTGFSTVSYTDPQAGWNSFGILLLIGFMIVGGGTGSTAGAIKQFRVVVLAKSILWETRRGLLPSSAVVENYVWHSGDRDYIDDRRIRQVATFATLYLLTLVIGTAILAAHGHPLSHALFEFASAQGTVGLSVGVTAPDAPGAVLWTEIAGMFLGRLEFLVVFVAVFKLVRDLRRL